MRYQPMYRPTPVIPPPPTPEQRARAVRRWYEEIRPTFQISDKPPPDTPVQAKAKLRAMRPDLSDEEFEAMFAAIRVFEEKTTFAPLKGTAP
jgi:hypothetical protein